jgi:hypothetical protein
MVTGLCKKNHVARNKITGPLLRAPPLRSYKTKQALFSELLRLGLCVDIHECRDLLRSLCAQNLLLKSEVHIGREAVKGVKGAVDAGIEQGSKYQYSK